MSNGFLKQLYLGKVVPWELQQDTSELSELSGKIDTDIIYLKEKLSDADKEVLERLTSNLSALESEQACRGYVNGFKQGSLMMMEILAPNKSL